MAPARIYQPAKTATSSGRAKTRHWVLEMEPRSQKETDPLMGWVGSDDTEQQVQIRFPDLDSAVAFAKRKGIDYRVHEPRERQIRPKSYAENFIRRV